MKRYRVIYAPVVSHQIEAQVLFIARGSIDSALAWEDRLRQAIDGLAEFNGYAFDEDASDRLGQAVRKLVFESNYLIHYTVDEDATVVKVINMRHVARLPLEGEP